MNWREYFKATRVIIAVYINAIVPTDSTSRTIHPLLNFELLIVCIFPRSRY